MLQAESEILNAMTESSDLTEKATAFLDTRSLQEVAKVLFPLFMDQESSEYQTSLALYEHCVATSPDALTRKLLTVYLSSSNAIFRFRAIHLLSETIADLRNCNFRFSLPSLLLIKPLVISCLKMQESKASDIKILARIVSFVAYNGGAVEWNELSDCILELANNEPRKAFHVFLDLPLSYGRFISRFVKVILDKAKTMFLGAQDWSLALQTVIKIGVQVSDSETDVERIVLKSAEEVVKKGMKEILERGLEDLKKFLARDGILCKYNEDQRFFVGWLVFKISVRYQSIAQSKKVTSEVLRVLKKPNRYDNGLGFARDWWDYLTDLSPVEVLKVYALSNIGEESRELAIKRLNFVLFEHTSEKVRIDVAVMRQLQGHLILYLKEEGISENMFKVLGQVVFHVANEMLSSQEDRWFDLWSYIASECKTEFGKAVYIFQCLTMWLEDKDFVIFAIDNLLPEITKRLKQPPGELVLVDDSCWVLAFVGAFCAIVHLIEIRDRVETVKEVTESMVDSVRELVGRGMEVGFVRRAFRDVESIVKKQLKWYSASEYRFVKGLLWRLYEIKGMEMESKIVLWRINKIVERGVKDVVKEYPKVWLDWLMRKPEA